MTGWSFLLLLIIIAAVVGVPLAAAWAVEVVFGFHIVMTPKTWFAIWLLIGLAGGRRS